MTSKMLIQKLQSYGRRHSLFGWGASCGNPSGIGPLLILLNTYGSGTGMVAGSYRASAQHIGLRITRQRGFWGLHG